MVLNEMLRKFSKKRLQMSIADGSMRGVEYVCGGLACKITECAGSPRKSDYLEKMTMSVCGRRWFPELARVFGVYDVGIAFIGYVFRLASEVP